MKKKKNRTRKQKPIDMTPQLAVGDRIKHPKYGIGVIRGFKRGMFPDPEFFYDADFTGKGGDGTKVWLPKVKTERLEKVVG